MDVVLNICKVCPSKPTFPIHFSQLRVCSLQFFSLFETASSRGFWGKNFVGPCCQFVLVVKCIQSHDNKAATLANSLPHYYTGVLSAWFCCFFLLIKESSALLFCYIMELGKTQAFVMISWAISAETSITFSSTANTLVSSLQENSTLLVGWLKMLHLYSSSILW